MREALRDILPTLFTCLVLLDCLFARHLLPDLGPVLLPLGSAALPVICLGA
jgi:hypothetical protein